MRCFTRLTLLLLLWAVPAQAAVLLTEEWDGSAAAIIASGWDTGSYGGFPDSTGYFSAPDQPFFLDSSFKFSGTQSLRLNYVGGQPTKGGGFSSKSWPQHSSEIYITWYNYMASGFRTGGAIGNVETKGIYFFMLSDTRCVLNNNMAAPVACGTAGASFQENGWVFGYRNGSRILDLSAQGIKDDVDGSGNPTPYDTAVFTHNVQVYTQPLGKWVCYEAQFKNNTPGQANGEYRLWATNVTDTGPTILTTQITGRRFLDDTPTESTYPNSNVRWMPSDSKWYKIRMYRQDGIGTMWYDKITVSTTRVGCTGGGGGPSDTTPPSTPTATASVNSGTQATINWTAATDNVGVTSYQVLRSTGATVPTVVLTTKGGSTLFHVDATLSPGITYNYRVRAGDAAGNLSPPSATTSITTPSAASGSFRRTLFVDPFTRADSTDLGTTYDAGYPAQTNAQIGSNQVRGVTVNTRSFETYNGTATPNDQWAQATVKVFTGAQLTDQCVHVRADNAATMTNYAGCIQRNGANTMEIRGYTIGTPVVLAGNATQTPVAGDKLRMEVQGTALKLYLIRGTQEVLAVSTTDATIASGKTGLSLFVATGGTLTNNDLDDFAMGDFTGTADVGTFDAVSNSATGNTTNTISWSHTTGTGSNRAIAVCAQGRDPSVAGDTAVSSMSYAGQALTLVRNDLRTDGALHIRTTLGYLVNPPSGTNTVQITWAGALSSYGVGTATSYSGIDQTSPLDAQAGGTGQGTTASAVITTVANNAIITDCAALQDVGLTIGAGQTSRTNRLTTGTADSMGVSTVLKATAGAETMDWTQTASANWAISTISFAPGITTTVVPPSIATVDANATTATLTYGATTPTSIRVRWEFGAVIEPIASFPSGAYTYPANVKGTLTNFICFDAMDAIGLVYNTICDSVPITAADTTPIVMSGAFPSTDLPAGTTSATFGFNIDKAGLCRWSTTDVAYDAIDPLTNQMNVASLTATATAAVGVGANTFYGRCLFTNTLDAEYPNLSSIVITVTVAASTADVTAPSTVAGLVGTALSNSQVGLDWPAATDAGGIAGYQVYQSLDGTNYALASGPSLVTTTNIQLNLAPSTLFYFKVKAVDTSNNLSAAFSNIVTVTTSSVVDITVPSTMVITGVDVFSGSADIRWATCTDDSGICFSTIEISAAGCTGYAPSPNTSNISTSHLALTLSPGTSYCARGFHTDQSGNRSLDFSNEITFTTAVSGVPQPRALVPFGVERDAATRDASGARTLRP